MAEMRSASPERAWRALYLALVGVLAFVAGFAVCLEILRSAPSADIKTIIADDQVHVWRIVLPRDYQHYQAYLECQEAPFANPGAEETLTFPDFDHVPWLCVMDFNAPGSDRAAIDDDLTCVSFRIALNVDYRIDILDDRLEGRPRKEVWECIEHFKTPMGLVTIGSDGNVRWKASHRISGTLFNIYNITGSNDARYSAVSIPNPKSYEDGEEVVLWMNHGIAVGRRAVRYRVRYAPVATALPLKPD